MITNYPLPQATIAQQLETINNQTLDRIHAVVVGPAFAHADIKAGNLVWSPYDESAQYAYLRKVDGITKSLTVETVVTDTVGLVVRNLRVELFTKGDATATPVADQFITYAPDPTGDLILFNSDAGILNLDDVGAVNAFDKGRAPAPGDLYKIATADSSIELKVKELVGQDKSADVPDTGYGYSGSLPWTDSTGPNSIELESSNFIPATPEITLIGPKALLRFHQNGLISPTGGLRIVFDVTCVQGGATASAKFSGLAGGVPVVVAAVAGEVDSGGVDSGITTFTVLEDLHFDIARGSDVAWGNGERFTVFIDIENEGDQDLLLGLVDVTNYTFVKSSRRVQSTLIAEVISLKADEATVRLTDSAGLSLPKTVVLKDGGPVAEVVLDYDGIGTVTVSLDPVDWSYVGGVHVGQRYTAAIVPPSRSTTLFDKVRLAGPIGLATVATGLKVSAYTSFTGKILANDPYSGDPNFTVTEAWLETDTVQVSVPGYPLPSDAVKNAVDSYGEVAVTFKALTPVGSTESLVPINSIQDIIDYVGSIAIESELGYGLLMALRGSQGKTIYGLNTGAVDTDTQAWLDALTKLESTNVVYSIALLTSNEVAMQALANHCSRLSVETIKRFRRGYVGTDSPGEYDLLAAREDGSTYNAKVELGLNNLNNLVTFLDSDVNLELIRISRGDKFVVSATGESYEIDSVTGPYTLLLAQATPVPISATPCKIVAADTAENTARYVWQRSVRLGGSVSEDRRISNIWTDDGYSALSGTNQVIPNRFGAAEIAGIRSALQPQQSLTRTEVAYIDGAPSMYTRFTTEILNSMAANGVWIVTQNSADAVPYIRHQLTTAVSNGSLYYEDSAGTNVDTVCFAIDDIVEPLIGKRNVTVKTVAEVKNLLIDMLTGLTEADYDSTLGPQLANFYNTSGDVGTIDVEINANFKDRIDVRMVLEIPLPLNNIHVVVLARTIRNDGVAVNSISTSVATPTN